MALGRAYPHVALLGGLARLSLCDNQAASKAHVQRPAVAVETLRNQRHPGRDVGPVLLARARHQIENLSDAMDGAVDHAQTAKVLAGVVEV